MQVLSYYFILPPFNLFVNGEEISDSMLKGSWYVCIIHSCKYWVFGIIGSMPSPHLHFRWFSAPLFSCILIIVYCWDHLYTIRIYVASHVIAFLALKLVPKVVWYMMRCDGWQPDKQHNYYNYRESLNFICIGQLIQLYCNRPIQ